VYAISHGGGPWPWIKGLMPVDWTPLENALQAIPGDLGTTPSAVLVISGHWDEPSFTVQTATRPSTYHDYYGFPDHTYTIEYPAPGSPELAEHVIDLLDGAGLPTDRDDRRGYDHGTFVPLHVMYPEATVPVVQLSMQSGYDPAAHLAAGRALAPLRDEGVFILGSGYPTFHDLSSLGPASAEPSRTFGRWLTDTMVNHVGQDRSDRLAGWVDAPAARACHPEGDHFVPLLVAVGAAEDEQAEIHYHEDAMMGYTTSTGYRLSGTATPA
jgi:aromatic ring-opening dioxygenase catalytic subunit (LigB family)